MRRALKKTLDFSEHFLASVRLVGPSGFSFPAGPQEDVLFQTLFVPGRGLLEPSGALEPPWPPGATVGLRWIGGVVPVLFSSFVSKHLFPYFIFGGAGQWGPVSLH